MKVEIWSDIMCPFCYIGKRKFEAALERFPGRADVEVIWRSFQLDPAVKNGEHRDYLAFLGAKKGMARPEVEQMFAYVTDMARQVGLDFHFETAIVANSLDAHRLTHFAATISQKAAAKEALFAAHFVDGKDLGNAEILVQIGEQCGLGAAAVRAMLASDQFLAEVQADISEAAQIGVQGVPFFVFDRKYAVSGAQDPQVFLQTLEKGF